MPSVFGELPDLLQKCLPRRVGTLLVVAVILGALPLQGHAQTRADLRSVSLVSPTLETRPEAVSIDTRPARCGESAASIPLQTASVPDRLSKRLAATPLFVSNVGETPDLCGRKSTEGVTFRPLNSWKMMPASLCIPSGMFGVREGMAPGLPPSCWPQDTVAMYRNWDGVKSVGIEPLKAVQPQPVESHYQWGPALIQSVNFLLFEHAFRLADDPYLRYLLFHKPFWRDWLISAGQFDMSRWGDGDDFLVNYIGHPMQGGVTGNIYIQNDPRARMLKFGRSKEYWQSRMKAMAWSAVYSAYFEIGPGLSEVAIGNEGGYTYTPGCGHYVCDRPGYKPPTNNTGWVDFIITPTMGTGLMILEDAIERELVDRLAKDDPRFKFKALRATLAPTHSMANMMAGRLPWFRYSEAALQPTYEPDLQRNSDPWRYERRWGAGVHYTNIDLPMDWPGCAACRVHSSGAGATLSYRLTNLMYLDTEVNVLPGSGSAAGKSRAEELLAGVKVGKTFSSWGMFATLRPGVIHYDKTLIPGSTTNYENASRFALDAGGAVEYYASSRSTIRFDVGTTLVRYLSGHPDPRQLPDSVLSTAYITTQGNFHVGSGYVFRF
jgi:hypothetical protein